MAVIDTVLLKVASRCNLDCSYCYVFNMGDDGWRRQPKRLSAETLAAVTEQLSVLLARQGRPFSIVLHGGEPLLLGSKRLGDLLSALRSSLPGCGLHVQTNGLLLTEEIVGVLAAYGVGVSVSLDGPAEVNDAFRVDHQGHGSFDRIVAGVELLRSHPDGSGLFQASLPWSIRNQTRLLSINSSRVLIRLAWTFCTVTEITMCFPSAKLQ